MLHTALCDLLGIELPILAAPMGPSITGPALAAAVSDAGGLGVISFGAKPASLLREEIAKVRALTTRPFGVNFLVPLTQDAQVQAAIDERVPVLSFFWGDAAPWIERAHAAGLNILVQVGSVADAW